MTMYTALATTTLSSSASSVTFGSIPQGYRDLMLVVETEVENLSAPGGTNRNLLARFNGATTGYSGVVMSGYDSSSTESAATATTFLQLDRRATSNSARHVHILNIMDYATTDKHKTVLVRAVSTRGTEALALRHASTSAVTSISVFYDSNSLKAGSTFSLYGIAGGS